MKLFKFNIIIFLAILSINSYCQTNLNLLTANATVSGTSVNVTYTTNNTLPAGFVNPINVLFRVPSANIGTVSFNITSNPFGLGYAFDFDGMDGFQYYMFQSLTAVNTNSWVHPTTINVGTFNILGSPNATLTTFGQFGNFWNGTAANLVDDNLVGWPVNVNLALPIVINNFSVYKDGDHNARLDWSTSLEINSAYFGIERSTDGNTWEAISKVAAAGNSNTEQLYTYTDRDLPLNRSKDQIFYYRLQLVDLDGQYKYSDIRGVNFGKVNTNKIISLYPNPAVQMVNLDLSGMDLESGAIHLRVTDMQGRNMIDKTILGNGIEPIEVTQLPAGTYNVAVSQGANLYQKQFIKIE